MKMQNLFYVIFFIIIIHFITNAESFTIRRKNSSTKRITKDTSSNQYAVTSQGNQQFTNVKRKDSEGSMEDTSDDMSTHPHYKFSYKVFDPETGDDKEHNEERDGELVQGEYSLIEPDGSRRIVTYISNGTDGFNAVIKRIKPTKPENFAQKSNIDEEATISSETEIKSHQDNKSDSKSFKNEKSNIENDKDAQNLSIPSLETVHDETQLNSQYESTAKPSQEQAFWFSTKTEYLSPDVLEQKDTEDQQLVAQESQNNNVFMKSAKSPTHFITYSLLIPQISNIFANVTKNTEISQNFETKTSSKKSKKSQKINNKNIQVQLKSQDTQKREQLQKSS